MSDAAILRFEAVSAVLGGRPIVEEIEFSVAPGEIVGLVGRNGAGKTTLLRLAGGTLAPRHGCVRLGGEPRLRGGRESTRRRQGGPRRVGALLGPVSGAR